MEPRLWDFARRAGRRRCPAHVALVLLAAAGVLLACPTATRAESASAPDSARIVLLQFALRVFDDVRVVTDSAKFIGSDAVISSDGLRMPTAAWHRRFVSWTPPREHLIRWAEIESIHVRKGTSGIGPLVGGAIGLAIGFSIAVARQPFFSLGATPETDASPILLGIVGGAALGALLDRPGPWQSVYP